MMIRTRTGHLVLALAFAASVTACTPTANQTTPAATASTTATPTPTPTPTTLSSAEQDLVNAKAAVTKMWAEVDRLVNNPKSSSIQDLDAVAQGATLTMFQENLGKYRAANWTGSGDSVVEAPTAAAAAPNAQGQPTWTVTACIDSSKTTLVDANGKSVQGPPYRVRHSSTVVKRSLNFYVANDVAVGTC